MRIECDEIQWFPVDNKVFFYTTEMQVAFVRDKIQFSLTKKGQRSCMSNESAPPLIIICCRSTSVPRMQGRMFVHRLVGSGWKGLEAKSVIGRLVCWQALKV